MKQKTSSPSGRRGAPRHASIARGIRSITLGTSAFLGVSSVAHPARAYDAATTHAGLTQQAVNASHLHQWLTTRLGRALGVFDLVRLDLGALSKDEQALWRARLMSLDAAAGYRPDGELRQAALGWVQAGAVLSHSPSERARLSFLDPSTGRGLAQDGGGAAWADGVGSVFDQASLRGVVTGAGARREAPSAWEWVSSPANDEGLPSFEAHLAEAVSGASQASRDAALARALLSLGGVLGVLEDMGEPAHVRNDLDRAFLSEPQGRGHEGPFNRGSLYERWVADRYGVSGVPAPGAPVVRDDARSFFSSSDGNGLADRTQRRFFSQGTLPADQPIDTASTPRQVATAAQASLTYGLPAVEPLALGAPGTTRYLERNEGGRALKVLGYRLDPGHVRFLLDDETHAAAAAVLLPETAAYAAGLVDHLFRAEVTLMVEDGLVRARIAGTKGALVNGTLTVLSEDQQGRRQVIGTFADVDAASVPVPTGARRVVAFARGRDQAGSLIALGSRALSEPAPAAREATESKASEGAASPPSGTPASGSTP